MPHLTREQMLDAKDQIASLDSKGLADLFALVVTENGRRAGLCEECVRHYASSVAARTVEAQEFLSNRCEKTQGDTR